MLVGRSPSVGWHTSCIAILGNLPPNTTQEQKTVLGGGVLAEVKHTTHNLVFMLCRH